MLPKSLHTVRILVAVARAMGCPETQGPSAAVMRAAAVLGYIETVRADDPLIIKAAAQLTKGGQS